MKVILNGQTRSLPEGASVLQAVAASGAPEQGRGVAVAIDGTVLPHGQWRRVQLAEGQHVEVLQAVQGG